MTTAAMRIEEHPIDDAQLAELKRHMENQYGKWADEQDGLVLQLIAFYEKHKGDSA